MSLRPKRVDFDATVGSLLVFCDALFGSGSGSGTSKEGNGSSNTNDEGSSFMDPFQQVYDLCTAFPKPFDDRLFDALGGFLVAKVEATRERILDHDDLVSAYALEWSRFRTAATYLDKICEYLNKIIAKKKSPSPFNTSAASMASRRLGGMAGSVSSGGGGADKVLPIKFDKQRVESLAYLVWKEFVLNNLKKRHSNRLLDQVFDFVTQDRDGVPAVGGAVIIAVESFVQVNEYMPQQLQYYIEEYEQNYLNATRQYYTAESNTLISTLDISSYMKKITSRLAEEESRSSRFCHVTSHEKVKKECEAQCIAAHQKRIYNEFEGMLKTEKFDDAQLTYSLMLRIPDGISPMLEIMQKHVISLGKDVVDRLRVGAQKDPRDFITALIELHERYTAICAKYFNNDAFFGAAIDKAFRSIVNESYENASQNFPELLSRYCDGLLKKSAKSALSESELEERISRVIIVFKYLNEKDIFQKFYSRMLAKRLIYSMSVSDDMEMNLISGLKAVCGVEYTTKLQRMFTDITLSHDLNKRFQASTERAGVNLGLDFSVYVLTQGSWPLTGSSLGFHIPEELEKSMTRFSEFYMNAHNGRKLTWMFHLSKADVRLTHLDKKYELNVSLHQLGILLLFNPVESITVAEMAVAVKLSEDDVRKIAKALIDLEVLSVSNPAMSSDSVVSVNYKFTNKRTKLKVSAATASESVAQESESTRTAVDEDRKIFLQATIVRILKSRKVIAHTQLVQQVIEHSKGRFLPSVPLIKKGVEQLIEKGYMERSPDRKDQYVYIA
ncbi:Cullin-domain-containing protein [Rhizoclosmatium globosum]|uniref:Cullin-5 n=1 Tax=Rhizoclosmatium globosum TaxID=329046 RepID=A0A1Y2BNN0_9FUNG|nr:Cullin-domain-containing protein [Rhizoclosmatium globosum]|eukprot:ORY36360.1 Cullin-domain-containing protein [Rhizoclosmatium globosum]